MGEGAEGAEGEEEAEGMQTMVVKGEAEGGAGGLREVVEAVEEGSTLKWCQYTTPFHLSQKILDISTMKMNRMRWSWLLEEVMQLSRQQM
jgi:hypothetical protein